MILLNLDGAAILLVISGTLGGRAGSLLWRLVVKLVSFLSFSVLLHQMCARAAKWRSVSELSGLITESGRITLNGRAFLDEKRRCLALQGKCLILR